MGIDYSGAIRCGRHLSSMAHDIERLRSGAEALTDIVPSAYDGPDARSYMEAVEQLRRELKHISSELRSLGDEVISVAEEIRREEERRAREAAARAAAASSHSK